MSAEGVWQREKPSREPPARGPGWRLDRALLALGAGALAMGGFQIFWQSAAAPLVAPLLAGLHRSPDDLAGLLTPLLGGFVAASFERRGWWWLGQGLAFPAVWSLHMLFLAGIQALYHRPPSLAEEWRFLLTEGHRLAAGFVGAYLGALAQRED
jgi:hypothetical protein